MKNINFLFVFYLTIHWVKSAQPIFLTSTSTMGDLRATPAEPASLNTKDNVSGRQCRGY